MNAKNKSRFCVFDVRCLCMVCAACSDVCENWAQITLWKISDCVKICIGSFPTMEHKDMLHVSQCHMCSLVHTIVAQHPVCCDEDRT